MCGMFVAQAWGLKIFQCVGLLLLLNFVRPQTGLLPNRPGQQRELPLGHVQASPWGGGWKDAFCGIVLHLPGTFSCFSHSVQRQGLLRASFPAAVVFVLACSLSWPCFFCCEACLWHSVSSASWSVCPTGVARRCETPPALSAARILIARHQTVMASRLKLHCGLSIPLLWRLSQHR